MTFRIVREVREAREARERGSAGLRRCGGARPYAEFVKEVGACV
jgi:hypothetical protein